MIEIEEHLKFSVSHFTEIERGSQSKEGFSCPFHLRVALSILTSDWLSKCSSHRSHHEIYRCLDYHCHRSIHHTQSGQGLPAEHFRLIIVISIEGEIYYKKSTLLLLLILKALSSPGLTTQSVSVLNLCISILTRKTSTETAYLYQKRKSLCQEKNRNNYSDCSE